MPLPVYTNLKTNTSFEPIYNDLFEIIISSNDIDYLIQEITTFNHINGSLVFTYRNGYNEKAPLNVSKFFRQAKINKLVDDEDGTEYKIHVVQLNRKGEIFKKYEFIECDFIGCSGNMFHFSYKQYEEEII